ncbi:MAG: hypothetical protein WCY00_01680 [Candidatus Dojkabacteria bacterium]|jgi:hypothetical protein
MKSENKLIDNSGQQLLNEIKVDSFATIFFFSIQDFLRWWYIKMPVWHLRRLLRLSIVIDDQFSISLLIKHFFVPWHRDYSLIGYLFGILMKILYLPLAIALYVISMISYILIFLIWLILPIASLLFIIISLF